MILSKPAGVWGADSGSNEKGVCVGLMFSEGHRSDDGKLNGTDLVRCVFSIDIVDEMKKKKGRRSAMQ